MIKVPVMPDEQEAQMREEQKEFHQDPDSKAEFPAAYFIELLFEREGKLPAADEIARRIGEKIGRTDMMFDSEQMYIFHLKDKPVAYRDKKTFPAGISIGGYLPFDPQTVTGFERSQYWNVENADALLARCRYKVLLGDWMAAGLPYAERAELLQGWLELAWEWFPDCAAVRFPVSGKLMTADQCRDNPYEGALRFLHGGINLRFFNIAGREEYLADSMGLFALGLPDVQCHFHTLDPNEVVGLVFNVAAYLFEKGDVIADGETVPGLGGDERWHCQHENSLIQPSRVVLDLNPGRYAAGRRQEDPERAVFRKPAKASCGELENE